VQRLRLDEPERRLKADVRARVEWVSAWLQDSSHEYWLLAGATIDRTFAQGKLSEVTVSTSNAALYPVPDLIR